MSVYSRLDNICVDYPLLKIHVEPLFQQIPSISHYWAIFQYILAAISHYGIIMFSRQILY